MLPVQGAQVLSLAEELRLPYAIGQKKKRKKIKSSLGEKKEQVNTHVTK